MAWVHGFWAVWIRVYGLSSGLRAMIFEGGQWPILKTITCIVVTSFGGQLNGKNGEFLVFMEVEDSAAEGLVRVTTHEKDTNA